MTCGLPCLYGQQRARSRFTRKVLVNQPNAVYNLSRAKSVATNANDGRYRLGTARNRVKICVESDDNTALTERERKNLLVAAVDIPIALTWTHS